MIYFGLKFYLHHTADLSSPFLPGTQFLFNDSKHLLLQTKKGWHTFEYREIKSDKVSARISFQFKAKEAISPWRAPFGGFEFYRKLSKEQLEDFVIQIQQKLIQLGVNEILIRNHPNLYNECEAQLLNDSLLNLEFKFSEDVCSIILVDEKPYHRKIKISERQKLVKAEKLFEFERVNRKQLPTLYSFIASCREERNQSLSMTLPELRKLVTVFPDRILFFKVGTNSEISAAAIVIRVSKTILYTFYYAHKKTYNRISPAVFLISGIYDYALKLKISMIDLGTSMINGHVNKSLLHFKTSIGGVVTKKQTFTKML